MEGSNAIAASSKQLVVWHAPGSPALARASKRAMDGAICGALGPETPYAGGVMGRLYGTGPAAAEGRDHDGADPVLGAPDPLVAANAWATTSGREDVDDGP